MTDSLWPHGLYSPWNSPGWNTGVGHLSLLLGSSQPRDQPRSPTLQADSLSAEPQGKPRNIGVGSLSLLPQIFLTQELNWGLLHCTGILYQLSYEERNLYGLISWDWQSHDFIFSTIFLMLCKLQVCPEKEMSSSNWSEVQGKIF